MKNNRTSFLIISTLGAFWTPFITSSINIALPYITKDLQISSSLTNWITSSTVLAIAIFTLPSGKVSDLIGRIKAMLIGAVIMTIASLICALAGNIVLLLFGRIIQGIGGALIATSVIAIVSTAFPINERGRALGINVACTYIGLSTGPIIGGYILSLSSWRGIFYFCLPIGIILSILLFKLLPFDERMSEDKGFDIKGFLIYSMAIFLSIFGLSNLLIYAWSKYAFLLGIILLAAFINYEKKISNPIINVNVLKSNRVLIFSSLASLINYSSTFAISYLMSLYLQVVQGIEPSKAGIILLAQPVVQAILSPIAGRLSDRISSQILASSGMILISIALMSFYFFNFNTPELLIIFILAIIGIGHALFSSPNTNAIMTSVERKYYGVASGIQGTARTIGQSFSMALTAFVTSIFLGNAAISEETAGAFLRSFQVSFLILGILCCAGVFASMARGKVKRAN